MKKRLLQFFLLALFYVALLNPAFAVTCFWVGGTGTWDNSTDAAHWSSSTGGAGSTCAATGGVPKNAADSATFDASSGGGTVTVNTNLSISSITSGAFTGTLDWSANNNSVTLSIQFAGAGSGTRTVNLGNNVWTLTATSSSIWDLSVVTNLTLNANSSTIAVANGSTFNTRTFQGGGKTYNIVTLGSNTTAGATSVTGANTFATLNITAPNNVTFASGVTQTITNAFTWAGSSGTEILIAQAGTVSGATISVATGAPTLNWAAIKGITFAGGATFAATNSFGLGSTSGITITPPASGGSSGGFIIGGWLLGRDINPANDNTPMFLKRAA